MAMLTLWTGHVLAELCHTAELWHLVMQPTVKCAIVKSEVVESTLT
jgi:hypothetical protein